MACGCTSTCGCIVNGIDPITVERVGDTFNVGVVLPIEDVADTDCLHLEIDFDTKVLTGSPILSTEPGSVVLECTEDGLSATVVPDPSSTAIVSVGPDGLKVDVPAPDPTPDGRVSGETMFHLGLDNPIGWLEADGGEVGRATYPELHDTLSLVATAGVRVTASDLIDGIFSTSLLGPGMVVEADGFNPGTTIVAVTGLSQIQVSTTSVSDGADTEVRVYPHGDGDGFSTFALPDMSDRYPRGFDYNGVPLTRPKLGATGGSDETTITPAQMPSHLHPITDVAHDHDATSNDSGHGHPGSSTGAEPNHTHGTATFGRLFVESDGSPQFVAIANDSPDDIVVVVSSVGAGSTQLTDGGTGAAGGHSHTVTVASGTANVSTIVTSEFTGITTTELAGAVTPDPIEIQPKHLVGRWLVHV